MSAAPLNIGTSRSCNETLHVSFHCSPVEVRVPLRRTKRRPPLLSSSTNSWFRFSYENLRRVAWIFAGLSSTAAVVWLPDYNDAIDFVAFLSHAEQQQQQYHRRQFQIERQHPLSSTPRRVTSVRQRRQLRASSADLQIGSSTNDIVDDNLSSLRYLSFGSSNTWGIGLEGRLSSDELSFFFPALTGTALKNTAAATTASSTSTRSSTAYPHLLDPEALSVALPTGHVYADLAAACTQTMVDSSIVVRRRSSGSRSRSETNPSDNAATDDGEATGLLFAPDVITVEYNALDLTPSHLILLKRLRQRYPMSLVVLVQLLQPSLYWQLQPKKKSNNARNTRDMMSVVTLQEWRNSQDQIVPLSADDDEYDSYLTLARSMISATKDGAYEWVLSTPSSSLSTKTLKQLMDADQRILHNKDFSSTIHPNIRTNEYQLADYLRHFTPQSTNLSQLGHERVAQNVQRLVQDASALLSKLQNNVLVERSDSLGTASWGSGDCCNIWYATGNYNLESTASRANVALHAQEEESFFLPSRHKHSLDFVRSKTKTDDLNDTMNKITVHNPFATERLLSLTYLTDADGMAYPRTRVTLNGVPSVVLHPFHDQVLPMTQNNNNDRVGLQLDARPVVRTTGVGYIPPGASTVWLDPLQSTNLPFRLVGVSLLAEEVQHLTTLEFSLETDQ